MPYRDPTAALLDRLDELERSRLAARARLRRLGRARRRRARAAVRRALVRATVLVVPLFAGMAVIALVVQPGMRLGYEEMQRTSRASAKVLRQTSNLWLAEHGECPTPRGLVAASYIDAASKLTDAWENDYVISCEEDDVVVRSAGKDRTLGTADDVTTENK